MKNILLIFFLFLCYNVVAQQRFPVGVPTQFSTGFFKQGYHQSDSGTIIANRDTNWLAKYSGTIVFKPSNKQFYWFDSTTLTWNQFGSTIDTTSLSNRIDLKLNISDTADMLLPYLRKIDTTNKWVQDVYVRNDSLFKFKNGTETFLDTLGGGGGGPGTVTSVALSMPSAFSVSGSPITTSGTFNVSGAGTALQYIRGNGTLATTDTGMIPDFYSKARGLLSATSPITYNSTTGAIGIQNATASGTKGAATFVNSSFSDNGSGTIDLADVTGAGGCINCDITFDTKGRAISYASGTPPQFVNAPGAGDTLSISDTLKRLNAGYGIDHAVTNYNITHSVDTSEIATQYGLSLKLNIADTGAMLQPYLRSIDTTNKWINDIRRRSGTDTVEKFKNGSWQFAFIDSTRAPELYGTLYDENTWTAVTDDWSINGGTWAVSANKITATGGNQSISATLGTNNSAFNQYLKLTAYGYSMLQRVKIGFKIRLTSTPGATTYGFAIGKMSDNTISLPSNVMAYFNTSTNTGTGKVYVLTGQLNTTTAISDNAVPVNQDDYFYVTLEKNLDQVTVSVKNLTVDTTFATVSYTYNTNATVGALMDNTGHYGIASLGGNFTIDSVNITSDEVKNSNLMFLTDSKGEYGSPWTLNFPHLVGKSYWGTISCADQSGRSQDLINRLPEVLALRPKQAIIAQTRNDIFAGTPTATWQQNLITIDSTLRANGVSVFLLDAIYETSINQGAMVDWIDSAFGERVIHTYYPGNVTGSRIADNIHPSVLGMKIVSNVILSSNKLANYSNYLNDVYNSQIRNPAFDSIWVNNGIKCINCTFPDSYGTNDYVMPGGAAITAAISPTWKSRLVLQSTTTAAMEFFQYYGQATSCVSCNGGFRWYTGLHTAGSSNRVASLSVGGVFTTGPNPQGGFSSQDYDIGVPAGSAFYSAVANTVGQEARLVLSETSTQNTSLRNYMSTATMDFFVSGGTLGNQLNAISINPVGAVRINTTSNNSAVGSRKIYINGSIGANKDSITTVGAITSEFILLQDTSAAPELGKFKKILPANLGFATGNTLYTGDGTISGNRNVNVNNLNLTFSDVNTFRMNMDVFALSRADGTFPFSSAVIAPAQQLRTGYTPTVGTFSKGAAVSIDTNNNVSLGTGFIISTHPLYTYGSAFAQGFTSARGNFYRVDSMSADATATIEQYYFVIDASSGNVTITLPAASTAFGNGVGVVYKFYRIDNTLANTVTIAASGTDTINGAASQTLTAQYEEHSMQCISATGGKWAYN